MTSIEGMAARLQSAHAQTDRMLIYTRSVSQDILQASGELQQVLGDTSTGEEVAGELEAIAVLVASAVMHEEAMLSNVGEFVRYLLPIAPGDLAPFIDDGPPAQPPKRNPIKTVIGLITPKNMPEPTQQKPQVAPQPVEQAKTAEVPVQFANVEVHVAKLANNAEDYGTASGRLHDLLAGTRTGNISEVVAATVVASIMSGESDQARLAYGRLIKGTDVIGYGSGVLNANLGTLRDDNGQPRLDVLVLAADVMNNTETSVLQGKTTSKDIITKSQVTAAVRANVEKHYNFTTNDEATIGFLAECRIAEQTGNASPQLHAAIVNRLSTAWSKMNTADAANPVLTAIYFRTIGATPPITQ
jgi:hypothetical protein